MSKLYDSFRNGSINECTFVNTAVETPYVYSAGYGAGRKSTQFVELDYAVVHRMIAESNEPLDSIVDKILNFVETRFAENEWHRNH